MILKSINVNSQVRVWNRDKNMHIKRMSMNFRSIFKTQTHGQQNQFMKIAFESKMKVSTTLLIFSLGLFAVMASPIEKESKRLIKTSEQDPGTWMTEDEVVALAISTKGFVDITDNRDFTLENVGPQNVAAIPTSPRFQGVVNNLIRSANRTRVESFIWDFSSFHNRNYNNEHGERSEKWLLGQVEEILSDYRVNNTIREVSHTWRQNSIVTRIVGLAPGSRDEIVILGAHQDSLSFGGSEARAPGADDNGSGSAVLLETLRLIVTSGIRLNRTIEFHWYAAEEQGLLGSAAIAKEYKDNNVSVVAMLNLDVVGWQAVGINDIGIYTDNGNDAVIQFNRLLADEYLTYGRRDTRCGYGCSDHASWTANGFPAAMAAEYEFHPYMHSERDNFENVGFTQVMEFVKLAVGFMVEVAVPIV